MIKNFKQYITEGAWGYGSLDNDYVLDDRDELLKDFIQNVLNKCNNISGNGDKAWKAIGLIDILIAMLRSINTFRLFCKDINILEIYENAIKICKNDTNFINSWKEPKMVKASLLQAENKLLLYKTIINTELKVRIENNGLLDE